jgi:aryl carrier-like protein
MEFINTGGVMGNSLFGNLTDWGSVMEKLQKLSDNRELGQYQDELIRLLRFDQNWRLREAAVEAVPLVENPKLDLARELVSLITRKDLYFDVRILASHSLGKLADIIHNNRAVDKDILKQFFMEIKTTLESLLASPEPPKFHEALQIAVNRLGGAAESI